MRTRRARHLLALLTVLTGLLLVAPAVSAQSDTIVVQATREACPDGRTYCFAGQQAALLNITPGQTVTIRFENLDTVTHNALVALPEDADIEDRSTDPEDALAGIAERVPSGTNETFELTLPEGTTAYYLWCDVTGHESLGMWTIVDLEAGTVDGLAQPREGPATTPGIGVFALIALAAGAMVGRRRNGGEPTIIPSLNHL